jgi:arabinogalactan oligomer/maltooligosaccharide transport system permease protein
MKSKKRISLGFIYALIIVLAIVWLFPIFWIIMTSLRGEGGAVVEYIIPKNFSLENYAKLFNNSSFPFAKWFGNTLFVAICTTILTTLITMATAYCLSRIKFKFRNGYLKLALVLNMFPGFMSMYVIYWLLKSIGLTGSIAGLIVVYSAGAALGFYIAKGFFDTIPYSLDESAMLDGATRAEIFFKITLPLSKPMIVYTSLMAFMGPWMDYIFAQVILGDNVEQYTIAIGLFKMTAADKIQEWFTTFTAGCVIVAIPITVLFIVMQKFYVEGITAGGVKG